MHSKWELSANLADKQVLQNTLIMMAENEPILIPASAEGMERAVPNLTRTLIKDCGHWTQQEQPAEVNRLILEFLADLRK